MHTFKVDVDKEKPICLKCKRKIKKVDLEYEDYFVLFRGLGEETFRGFICFDCIDDF